MRNPLLQALIIVVLGIGAGLVHRQLRPFTLELKPAAAAVETTALTAPLTPLTPATSVVPVAPTAQPNTPTPAQPNTPVPPPAPSPGPEPAPIAAAPASGIYITTDQAKAIFEAQSAEWIDSRNKDEFDAGSIPGAFHIPPVAFAGGQIPAVINIFSPAKQIIVYCGGGECDASNLVALRLQGMGLTNVVVYKDGFTGWTAAKLPITTATGGGK